MKFETESMKRARYLKLVNDYLNAGHALRKCLSIQDDEVRDRATIVVRRYMEETAAELKAAFDDMEKNGGPYVDTDKEDDWDSYWDELLPRL